MTTQQFSAGPEPEISRQSLGRVALVCAHVRKYLTLFRENARFSVIMSHRNPVHPFLESLKDYLPSGQPVVVRCENTVNDLFSNPQILSLLAETDAPLFAFQPLGVDASQLRLAVNPESTFSQYENKKWLRERFASLLTFPDFDLWSLDDLLAADYKALLKRLGHERVVVQLARSTAGLGTGVVDGEASFDLFKNTYLAGPAHRNDDAVVSRFVEGQSIAVQACIADGICYWSSPYVELFDDPVLTHGGALRYEKYAGSQFGMEWPTAVMGQVEHTIAVISPALAAAGYRGVFGVDFVLGDDAILYLLEVNARCTAVSPIVAGLQLKAGNDPFLNKTFREIVGGGGASAVSETRYTSLIESASFLKLQNMSDTEVRVGNLRPGVYTVHNGNLVFRRHGFFASDLRAEDEVVIYPLAVSGSLISPGERYADVLMPFAVLTECRGSLSQQAVTMVNNVHKWAIR